MSTGARRGRERRRFVRVDDEAVVELTSVREGARDGRTLNFSAGGVLLLTEAPVPVGAEVHASLRVADEERPLTFVGRVVRVRTLSDRTHELALEFVGGSAGDQRALQDLIAARHGSTPAPCDPRTA